MRGQRRAARACGAAQHAADVRGGRVKPLRIVGVKKGQGYVPRARACVGRQNRAGAWARGRPALGMAGGGRARQVQALLALGRAGGCQRAKAGIHGGPLVRCVCGVWGWV